MSTETILIIALSVVAVVAIVSLVYTNFYTLRKIKITSEKKGSQETDTSPFLEVVQNRLPDLIFQLRASESDPQGESKGTALLQKLKIGAINQTELQELEMLIKEELDELKSQGNSVSEAMIFILLLGIVESKKGDGNGC